MNEKYSKYLNFAIEILFLALVILAPLFFDRRLSIVFSLSKATIIRIFTLVISGLYFSKLVLDKNRAIIRTPLDIPVLTYILCALAATINSVNVYVSFVGSYGRYEGFITIINYAILFFLTSQIITKDESRRRIMMSAIICGVVMAIYGIIQRTNLDPYEWGGVVTNERIIATIGQPNFLAAYLDMAFMFCLGLIFYLPNKISSFMQIIPPKSNKAKETRCINWNEILSQINMISAVILAPVIFVFSLYYFRASDNFIGWIASFLIIVALTIYFSFNFERLDSRILKSILVICLVFNFIGILATQSRGGWLAFICGFVVFIILTGRKIFFENKTIWLFIGFIGILIIGYSSISLSERFFGEFKVKEESGINQAVQVEKTTEGDNKKSKSKFEIEGAAGSRIETWTSAVKIISKRPVFGIGPEVIKMLFPQDETPYFRFKEGFHVKQDRCHNETLDMAVTRGIITLIVYLYLLFCVFKTGINNIKEHPSTGIISASFLAALAAYLVQNQFSFGVVAITSLFWITMGMAVNVENEERISKINVKFLISNDQLMSIALIWILVIILSVYSTLPYISDRYFKSAKTFGDSNMPQEAANDFKKAISITPYEPTTYTHYGMSIINLQQDKIEKVKESIAIFEKGQAIDPYNADNFYMAGRAYLVLYERGDKSALDIAEVDSNRALKIDPYYAESYQNLAVIYERRGKVEDAVKMYEKAFMANPSLMYLASSLYSYYSHAGKTDKAIAIFENVLLENPRNEALLIMIGDLYSDLSLIEKAKVNYSKVLSFNKKNVKAYAGLGIALLKGNDYDAAFDKFQQAMIIDPSEPLIHNGLGLYYLKKNDKVRAKEEFEQAVSLGSQNEYVKKMLTILK